MNNDTYNYVKESEFVSDTFAEHDTNEINELKKSLKESLGVVSPENGKLNNKVYFQKIFICKFIFYIKCDLIFII